MSLADSTHLAREPASAGRSRRYGFGSSRRRFAPILVLALAAVPASGQVAREPDGASDRFDDAIDVRVLNLEVQVRDSLGRLVTGLPESAFRVVLGAEELPIAHFDEVLRIDPRVAAGEELDTPTVFPAAPPPAGSNYLFFLDNEVTLKARRNFVLGFLRNELERLEPRDLASIVAFDGKRLEVLSEWSGSIEHLDLTLADAMAMPANGIRHIGRRRMPNFVANWEGNAARRSVLAAAAALRALPAPPGRKVLILVAGSWDPMELARADGFAAWCVSGDCGGLRVLRVLTDTANFLDYSIVAVDVEGRDIDLDWQREKRLQEALTYLAQETGGEVLFNGERRRMLTRAAQAGLSYYSLAVYPPVDLENLRSRVRVLVEGEDLHASTQRSFVNLQRDDDEKLEVLNTLLLRDRDIDAFPVTVGPPEGLRAGRALVPITIAVPLAELTWIPADARLTARYDVQIATQDGRDHASDVETHEFEHTRDQPPAAADFEFVEVKVNVKRRKQTLSVVIRDRQSEATLSVVMPFEPRPKKYERLLAESGTSGGS